MRKFRLSSCREAAGLLVFGVSCAGHALCDLMYGH